MTIGAWFGTEFDVPPAVLDLPVSVTGGQDPGVCIVDQVTRGTGIIGRVTGDFGAVALKIRTTGTPVRVTVVLHVDEVAARWWADRVKPPAGAAERPRLVLIRSQGGIRGAAVLARPQGWLRAGGVRQAVVFDLAAEELDADGLLVVELADPATALPDWVAGRLSDRAAIGMRIDSVDVRPLPAPADGPAGSTTSPTGSAFLVRAPGDAERFRLALQEVPPAPPVPRAPSNRWTRRKPARAAAKVLRTARRVAGRAAAETTFRRRTDPIVRAVDLITGAPVPVDIVGRDQHGVELLLGGRVDGPVLVGLDDPSGLRRPRTNRQLACRVCPSTEQRG